MIYTPCGSLVLISEGMDGGGILLQRVVHSGIKRQHMLNEANFMFYSIKLSVRSPLLSLLCQCNILGCITNKIFEKKLFLTPLRVCPREHQAVALHAISPISMKVCQFKGSTLKLKQATWFLFWLFPWVNTPPLRFFLVFPMEVASK